MSAIEVIEEIKKLPSDEQKKVLAFLQSQANESEVGEVDSNFKSMAAEMFDKNQDLFRNLGK